MALEEQHRKAVEQFVESLMQQHKVLFEAVRDCMLRVTRDGHTLPTRAVGAGLALLSYRVARHLQAVLQGEAADGTQLSHADVVGIFVDSLTNLISGDYGLLTLTISHKHLEFLRTIVYEHKESNESAKQLLGILSYAETTWAAMQQRRVEMEQYAKEAAESQLQ